MFKMQIIFILFLGICAVFDIRKKEIPLILIILGGILATVMSVLRISGGEISVAGMGSSLLPGLFFLFVSFCTKEKVGYGDGLILLISGLILGFYQCFIGMCAGLLFSSFFALALLFMHKAGKDSGLPFVPFLTIGMGVSYFV